jgi:hypothetical protein
MTRDRDRLIRAYLQLVGAHLRRGALQPSHLDGWTIRTFGVRPEHMTAGMMRTARRRLNAWRGGIEGRLLAPPPLADCADPEGRA